MGFFLTDPSSIFGCDIIPIDSQNHSEKYNSLVRLIFILTIILVLIEWKYTWLFFGICMIIIIVVYYSKEDCEKEKFNFVDKKNMYQTEYVNQKQYQMNNSCKDNRVLTQLEKVKNYNGTSQGYPNFNKPLYIPVKLYDLDAASGYNPFNVLGKINYEPVRELYPESKDFPNVIDPRPKKNHVQYLNNDTNNIVQSHGVLTHDQVRDLFKDSDRIIVNKNIEPANIPSCEKQSQQCNSCGTIFEISTNWCPTCGMGSANIDMNDTPQLQRMKTLPEWDNTKFKAAKHMTGPINKKENLSGYTLDGVTFFNNEEDLNLSSNYKPFNNGGLGVDPNDNGKIINRTNPSMYYRNGPLQESQYPKQHEFDDFAQEGLYTFNRYDPQLIRDQGLDPGRLEEMPKRNQFSQRMSRFEAPTHTTPLDQIDGNPEIDMYKLGYNGYKDTAGNIKYQVPEAVYQYPNFSKSKVDHMLYLNPMYQVMPEQRRVHTLQEARVNAENQWMNDSLNQRTDIMESYLDKVASRRAQQRVAPHSASRGMRGFLAK